MIFYLAKQDSQLNHIITEIEITSIEAYLTDVDTIVYEVRLSNNDFMYANSLNEVLKELDMLFKNYLKENEK